MIYIHVSFVFCWQLSPIFFIIRLLAGSAGAIKTFRDSLGNQTIWKTATSAKLRLKMDGREEKSPLLNCSYFCYKDSFNTFVQLNKAHLSPLFGPLILLLELIPSKIMIFHEYHSFVAATLPNRILDL